MEPPTSQSNVKSRLGPKLPGGPSQTPPFTTRAWEVQPQTPGSQATPLESQATPPGGQATPPSRTPHIRNPKLRQYYLQGTPWEVTSADATKYKDPSRDTSLCASSHFHSSHPPDALVPRELLVVPREKGAGSQRAPRQQAPRQQPPRQQPPRQQPPRQQPPRQQPSPESGATAEEATAQSPSPEAEYDKLLDVEAVPLPDGQLCLLALPPECCGGEGAEATPFLKLFCRYITDCKGAVSGILLVTGQKLFFDPCKTHPLVLENGCDDYVLSCAVDALSSVCVSHVQFNSTQQRRKGRSVFQSQTQRHTHEALSDGGVCEDDMDRGVRHDPEKGAEPEAARGAEPEAAAEEERSTGGGASLHGGLMFVRLRARLPAGRRKTLGLQLGSSTTPPPREAWLALSQESSHHMLAYLRRRRPDLRLLEGTPDEDDEEFVLIEDEEDEEEEEKRRVCGEDWEMVAMDDQRDGSMVLDQEPEGLQSIVERSHILHAAHVTQLCPELPARTVGRNWRLAYSTSRHGSSLRSLYRRVSATDSPALLLIKDALDEVFGAFLSHPLRPSEAFYGTGETFLFMLHPRFKCFRWTGENSFFIKGDLDSFAIGGGSGHFGLWVAQDLYLGRSSPCFTFNNCCLSETDDFRITELEVWTFG